MWGSGWRPRWDIWAGAGEGWLPGFAGRKENKRSGSPSLKFFLDWAPMNRIKRYLVGRDLLVIVTHQGDIRKLLGRRGESILIFVPEEKRTSPRRVQVKKHLHSEKVSEGWGGALPEVLPAQVVLLRGLHGEPLRSFKTSDKNSSFHPNQIISVNLCQGLIDSSEIWSPPLWSLSSLSSSSSSSSSPTQERHKLVDSSDLRPPKPPPQKAAATHRSGRKTMRQREF